MKRISLTLLSILSLSPFTASAGVSFEKRVLADRYLCDGINYGDFNRDGKRDIIAGPFWYAGPTFEKKHAIYPAVALPPAASPSNSMFSFVHDFDGDGWDDILVLGRVHKHNAIWYQNPAGKPKRWKRHFAFERIKGESPPFLDIDGDGTPELLTHNEKHWGRVAPDKSDPTKPWKFHPISEAGEWPQFYHGTGVGDVNGDGRLDLILTEGWYEQPAKPTANGQWIKHEFRFSPERGGAQMFAYDIDGDGDNDIITSLEGHLWGLAWWEQIKGAGGKIDFKMHQLMGDRSEEKKYGVAFSQPHAIDLADIDGDGLKDIVIGKRRWAHGPTGDVEPGADPVVYWFQLIRKPNGTAAFKPRLIDNNSGVGVQVTAADVNGDGKTDVLTASKLGTFLFLNQGNPSK
jgi:hypothetical protein